MGIIEIAMWAFGVYVFYKVCMSIRYSILRKMREAIDWDALPPCFVTFSMPATGSDDYDEIIEIAALRIKINSDRGRRYQTESYQTLVKINKRIPRRVREGTGITDRMLRKKGISLSEALEGFIDFIADDPLVGCLADVDRLFIDAVLVENNKPTLANLTNNRLYDLSLPDSSLYSTSASVGIKEMKKFKRRRALLDCTLIFKVFAKVKSR